jgi:type IV pilus assembly protein PilV
MRTAARLSLRVRASRGVSLVEVLVALLVLSIGMLGIAGVFVQNIRNSRSAILRTQAVNLVADMTDRVRANASAGAAYNLAANANAPAPGGCQAVRGSEGANCTTAQLAQDDLARWQAAVRGTLPSAGGAPPLTEVQYFPPASVNQPERFRVAVSWTEPSEPAPYRYESNVIVLPRPPT